VTTTACSRAERKNAAVLPRDLTTSAHIEVSFSLAKQKMQSKTDLIKTTLARGDWVSALRVASRFHDRSDDTMAFKRGFDAFQHGDFYRQLGKDPDELIHSAVERLQARFCRSR
jgi:hypothetical protein